MSLLCQTEELSREIERVTILRERVCELEGLGNVAARPAIDLMNAAIEAGHRAIGHGDTQTIIDVLRELRGFTG